MTTTSMPAVRSMSSSEYHSVGTTHDSSPSGRWRGLMRTSGSSLEGGNGMRQRRRQLRGCPPAARQDRGWNQSAGPESSASQ